MKKGGYQIIDLKGKEFNMGEAVYYHGIYGKVEGTKKVKLISGINIGGTKFADTYCDLTVLGTSYVGTIYGKTITIKDTDEVIITE